MRSFKNIDKECTEQKSNFYLKNQHNWEYRKLQISNVFPIFHALSFMGEVNWKFLTDIGLQYCKNEGVANRRGMIPCDPQTCTNIKK